MRPLKLVVSAFGPYANLQTVDFTELKDKNIFLITGPTGAGKTTIFDAISYALYGEASGSSRSKDSLRSDFAVEETLTYVELDFELRGKVYRIKRVPQQERKKLRGEGTSVKNTEAELILPNGEIITRVTTVDDKIIEILGINKNQFKQIVMLPQGEFRKLIEADSQERETIFRKIFGTEAFETIQRRLEEERKSIYKNISEKQTKRDTHIKNIEAVGAEALMDLISSKNLNVAEIIANTRALIETDEELRLGLEADISKLSKEQEELHRRLIEGQEINKKLKDRIILEVEYREHLSRVEEYQDKKLRLEKLRRALPIMELEAACLKLDRNKAQLQEEHKEAGIRLEGAKAGLEHATAALKLEEEREPQKRRLAEEITILKGFEIKVKDYEGRKQSLHKLNVELSQRAETLKHQRELIKNEKTRLEDLSKRLKETQAAELKLQKLSSERDEKQRGLQEVRELYKYSQQTIQKQSAFNKESKLFEELDRSYKEIKTNYEVKEDLFRRGQAGLLAINLEEGQECPVCGAQQHPSKAKPVAGMPTEAELKELKHSFERVSAEREGRLLTLSNLNGDIKSNLEELKERRNRLVPVLGEEINKIEAEYLLDYLTNRGQAISSELKLLEAELKGLEVTIHEKTKLEASIKECGDAINKNEGLALEGDKAYTQGYGAIRAEEELLLSIEKEIPEEIRALNKLTSKLTEVEGNYKALEEGFKRAQENYNSCSAQLSSYQSSWQLIGKNLAKAGAELEELSSKLNNRIEGAGFKDYDEFNALKTDEESIIQFERDINEFFQKLNTLKDRVELVVKETKDLQEVPIDTIELAVQGIKNRRASKELMEKGLFSKINNNKKALNEIEKINKDIQKEEERYKIVADLSKTANGDNSERITFERYVLAAYFDEIIAAANLRLIKMAGGRYLLKRKEEKGKGRGQEGLELEVFDNYTGKARHVKTLSGGESFKASLALALGLADVVQSYAGGISIDTMFVDEGFGTLDPESLDNAIQCLIDLQRSGRLVGIISHVPELKERLDVRLEITPAKEGSRVRFVV